MSEYWKSTPKYWCKHCSAYVKDTPFERKQHEATAKHQSNLKRFLRDIQNNHERGERDKDRAKAEVERLNKLSGNASHQSTTAMGLTSKAPPTTVRKTSTPAQTATDQKRQWSQLAEMGIKVPEQFQSEMAMAGDWRVVSPQSTNEPPPEEPLSIGIKKRRYEGQEEEEEAGEAVVRRGWGSTTKRYPGQNESDLDDLLSGTVSLKKEGATSSFTALKNEEKGGSKQESKITVDQSKCDDAPVLPVEAQQDTVQADGSSLVNNEADAVKPPILLDRIPEEVPIPVFKKRKAKGS